MSLKVILQDVSSSIVCVKGSSETADGSERRDPEESPSVAWMCIDRPERERKWPGVSHLGRGTMSAWLWPSFFSSVRGII